LYVISLAYHAIINAAYTPNRKDVDLRRFMVCGVDICAKCGIVFENAGLKKSMASIAALCLVFQEVDLHHISIPHLAWQWKLNSTLGKSNSRKKKEPTLALRYGPFQELSSSFIQVAWRGRILFIVTWCRQ